MAGDAYPRARTASGAAGLVAVIALAGIAAAGDDPAAVAIPGRPALVTAAPPAAGTDSAAAGPSSTYVELSVLGFTPPASGGVQAVVSLRGKDGEPARELGRFGLFPNEAFAADGPADAQRFVFRLPREGAQDDVREGAELSVGLVPYEGNGEGARLELGEAQIRRR